MARWKAWLCAATRPGRTALPRSGTGSPAGAPIDSTFPSRTLSAAPASTRPPLKSRSGWKDRAAMRTAV